MKKITFYLLFVSALTFGQQKSTGLLDLSTNIKAEIALDNGTSTATLTLTGPNDRWFALQFGSFSGGMEAGSDLVYWNNVTLVDARHNGVGAQPTDDTVNNWVQVSNTNNSPSAGLRTLVYSRPFVTGDTNDFAFNFNDTTIDIAWARFSSPSFTLAYHGGANRGVSLNVPISTLSSETFSSKRFKMYPNPTDNIVSIESIENIKQIEIFDIYGKRVQIYDIDLVNKVDIFTNAFLKGVYIVEITTIDGNKNWDKIIVE